MTSTLSFRLKSVIKANGIGSVLQHSTLLGKFFAGSLTAPTMESAELQMAHGTPPLGVALEDKRQKQIKLCSSSSEWKEKQSALCDRRQNWFMGKCVPSFFFSGDPKRQSSYEVAL